MLTWTHVSVCISTVESMEVHSRKERGQMSAICQQGSLVMTLMWSVIESCWVLNCWPRWYGNGRSWIHRGYGCIFTAHRSKCQLYTSKFAPPSRASGRAREVPLLRPGTAKLHWKAVHCQGEEPDLLQCPKTTWNGGECSMVAAITCSQQQGRCSSCRIICHYTWIKWWLTKPNFTVILNLYLENIFTSKFLKFLSACIDS